MLWRSADGFSIYRERFSLTHKQYDIAVIGGGTAGLMAAEFGAQFGAKVALVEAQRLGGECLWTGCVPSKALLAAAKAAHTTREAARFGVHVGDVTIDFAAVMHYVHHSMDTIYHQDSRAIWESQSIDVHQARAQFTDAHTLSLDNGDTLRAKYIVIATGSRPQIPEALQDIPYLTSETLFDLTELPRRLAIIGGGPIGTEMAQAFTRLGAQVTVIEQQARLLPSEDADAAAMIAECLEREGVTFRFNTSVEQATETDGVVTLHLQNGDVVESDAVLIAIGKRPNIDKLNLAAAGVDVRDGRLVVNDKLRTSQAHIYAAGDVTDGLQFTHYAGWQAYQVIRNMLFPLSAKGVMETVPHTTFTDPEIAQAGLTEAQARAKYGDKVQVTHLSMSHTDRAVIEGTTDGFMKIIHKGNGKLVGATIVGANAGEMINEWAGVIEKNGWVWHVITKMHVYPTFGAANVMLGMMQFRKQFADGIIGAVVRRIARFAL
ncbi:MAG: hypothetical protein D6737_11230 [Chloroflexi bacterium]|nr:MAG: hypothetical protein D6737_11230 [Chloroflexota bacterium]